jgi:hypothetical protein
VAERAQDPLADHGRRLDALERAEASRRWRPWFGQDRFDYVFDGGRGQRLAEATAAALGQRAPVVDFSQDRETNSMATLAAQPDATLGGVVVTRADEVLTAQEVVDLVAVAFARLTAEGRLILSCGAPGPDDPPRPRFNPTLGPSLPARYVAFVCREAGFADVEFQEWSEGGYLVVATR